MHNPGKTVLAQIIAGVLCGKIDKDCGQNARDAPEQDEQNHTDADRDNQRDVRMAASAQSQNALVNDPGHHARLDQVKGYLSHHKRR